MPRTFSKSSQKAYLGSVHVLPSNDLVGIKEEQFDIPNENNPGEIYQVHPKVNFSSSNAKKTLH